MRTTLILTALLTSATLSACGDPEEPCSGSKCAPAPSCLAGETLVNGVCEPDEMTCPSGQMLVDGACVPDGVTCDAGETLVNGVCVPDETPCEAGQTRDATGSCVPTPSCDPDEVLLNAECVRPIDKLIAEADVTEQENNDPDYGGASQPITLPAAGTALVVAGAIGTPVDMDGDSEPEQDTDAYTVTLAAGDLIQITLGSADGPPLSFAVAPPAGGLWRSSSFEPGAPAARQIFAPVAGDYTIHVTTTDAFTQFNRPPAGDPSWRYALSVEALPAPIAADTSAQDISGELDDLTDNLFRVTDLGAGPVRITTEQVSDQVEGAYYVGASLTTMRRVFPLIAGDERVIPLAAGEELILADWIQAAGADTSFKLTISPLTDFEPLGPISAATVSSMATSLAAGTTRYYTFSAAAGQVLQLRQSNALSLSYPSFDLAPSSGDPDFLLSGSTALPSSLGSSAFVYLKQGGDYVLQVKSPDDKPCPDMVIQLNTMPIIDLADSAPGDVIRELISVIARQEAYFVRLTLTSAAFLSGVITQPLRPLSVQTSLFSIDASSRADGDILQITGGRVLSGAHPAGDYLFKLTPFNGQQDITLALGVDDAALAEAEPNNTAMSATALGQRRVATGVMESGDVDTFAITLPAALASDEALRVYLLPRYQGATPSFTCELRDGAGALIAAQTSPNDCLIYGGALAAGTYTIHVSATNTTPSTYTLMTSVIGGVSAIDAEPNDSPATATALRAHQGKILGAIAPTATPEQDNFSFTLPASLAADQVLSFTLDADIARNNTDAFTLRIEDSAGATLISGVTSVKQTALAAGAYRLVVSRSQVASGESGRYMITGSIDTISAAEHIDAAMELIRDNNAPFTRTLSVSKPGCTIADVSVFVDASSPQPIGFAVELTSPDGSTVELRHRLAEPTTHLIETYPTTVAPYDSLKAFSGQGASGDWVLTIEDGVVGDVATLNSWGLAFSCVP